MKTSDTLSMWLYGIGILIVVGSHIYMLVAGLPDDQIVPHSLVNLVAATLLVFGWLKHTK